MPSGKKGGQGQNRENGGMREQGWQVGQQIREGAEQVTHRVREGLDTAREGMTRGYRRAEGTIARNPAPSLLIGFGVGFGLGVALVSLFGRDEETWAEQHVPGRIRHIPGSVRDAAKHVPGSRPSPGRGDREPPAARDPQASGLSPLPGTWRDRGRPASDDGAASRRSGRGRSS